MEDDRICKGEARVTIGRAPIQGADVQTWPCAVRETCKHYQAYKSWNRNSNNEINAFYCMLDDVAYKEYIQNEENQIV